MTDIKPALDEHEWRYRRVGDGVDNLRAVYLAHTGDQVVIPEPLGAEGQVRHGLAALCLHDQPVGFTREDVTRHRAMASCVRDLLLTNSEPPSDSITGVVQWARATEHGEERIDWHESMADRIEALLPPEETHATQRSETTASEGTV